MSKQENNAAELPPIRLAMDHRRWIYLVPLDKSEQFYIDLHFLEEEYFEEEYFDDKYGVCLISKNTEIKAPQ